MNDDIEKIRTLHRSSTLSWGGPGRNSFFNAHNRPTASVDHARSMLWRTESRRQYAETMIDLGNVERTLAWAYGVHNGRRNVPSAGGLYPLRCFASSSCTGEVYELNRGGRLILRQGVSTCAEKLGASVYEQISGSFWLIALIGSLPKVTERYGVRAYRYLLLEAGHAAQQILHQAAVNNYAACCIGAFDDDLLQTIVGSSLLDELPLYAVVLGHE